MTADKYTQLHKKCGYLKTIHTYTPLSASDCLSIILFLLLRTDIIRTKAYFGPRVEQRMKVNAQIWHGHSPAPGQNAIRLSQML